MDHYGCSACNSRESCTALCPAAARYVNQDHVYLREIPIGTPVITISPTTGYVDMPEIKDGPSRFTPREQDVLRLLKCSLNRDEICQVLDISKNSFRVITHRLRKKCNASPYK